ncbi:MAG: hypothetical protein COZ86_02245 [Candidatus Moranbacteria bacterium CG_4_8_14_3_um_filter_41_13]|nr:MAG: hypothetical protein COZ86_02245 [Candidatus Moranbacteria bacterium CG_4_8_14_3_um_filter_41_13]
MKNIKQIAYTGIASALAFMPLMAGAATPTPVGFGVGSDYVGGSETGLANESFYDLISRILNWLLGLTGILAVIGFVISGILYLTAAGDEDQVEKAKSVMMYSIIGLVVALIGLIVVNALSGLLGNAGGVTTF